MKRTRAKKRTDSGSGMQDGWTFRYDGGLWSTWSGMEQAHTWREPQSMPGMRYPSVYLKW
ncbi:MAG: hypothetical protein ACUVR2_02280 [Anaerolineae bacterium]